MALRHRAPEERPRHVRAVAVLSAAHVEQDAVPFLEDRSVRRVVRVRRVGAEGHQGAEGEALRPQFEVDVHKLAGHLRLRDALVNEAFEAPHGLIVDAGGGGHPLPLLRVLHAPGQVHGRRGDDQVLRRPALQERQQEARRHSLVDAQLSNVPAMEALRHESHHRVPVRVEDDLQVRVLLQPEQPVCEEDGTATPAQAEREEPLHGANVLPRQVEDGQGIHQKKIRHPKLPHPAQHPLHAISVHRQRSSFTFKAGPRLDGAGPALSL